MRTPPIDRSKLQELSDRSPCRAALRSRGYCAMHAAADLHEHGYTVRYWLRPADRDVWLEFNPTGGEGRRNPGLPRVALQTYADQAALHRALGLGIAGPGDEYAGDGPGLFDDAYFEAAAPAAPALTLFGPPAAAGRRTATVAADLFSTLTGV
jgi:hypothetical protein